MALRVETLITFWLSSLESYYFTSTMQPVVKLNVGFITAWTVLELTMRVEQGIQQFKVALLSETIMKAAARCQALNVVITIGRKVVIAVIIVELLSISIFIWCRTD